MFDTRNRRCFRWDVRLLLCIMAFSHTVEWCYGNSCPIFNRPPGAETPPKIPDDEVEKACREAKDTIKNKTLLEKDLIESGKTVNTEIKTAESVHPQAASPPIVREMEQRQMLLQEVTKILVRRFNLTSIQAACGLPNFNLTVPCLLEALGNCTVNKTIECDRSSKYRTADGTCNNLKYPKWGSHRICFRRLLSSIYSADEGLRKSACRCREELPSARVISTKVHSHLDTQTYDFNDLFMPFGQLLDHEVTKTPQPHIGKNVSIQCCPQTERNYPQCAPITIPPDDHFFGQFNKTCMNFVRSAICPTCTLGTRTQINLMTAWVDGSVVYGNSVEEMNSLRAFDGLGQLSSQVCMAEELLPASKNPETDHCSVPEKNQTCFRSGDTRVNENPLLALIHTLFHREHNRIARGLKSCNPHWNEERLFQEARKIFGAILQAIVYKEYLTIALGNEFMTRYGLISTGRKTYNDSVDPSLVAEFSIVFRFGHCLINSNISENPRPNNHTEDMLLRDVFFNPFGLCNREMDPLTRGTTRATGKAFNRHLVHDVRNLLFRIKHDKEGFDLAAFNIQRGRDHGIPAYVNYARLCGLHVCTFDDLVSLNVMSLDTVKILKNSYDCVEDIDLFTGIIAEKSLPGAVLGPTGACIVGYQFSLLQRHDRFYYENVGLSTSFSVAQIAEINKVTLARIICDNTKITEIQLEAMRYPGEKNPILNCSAIPRMNLSLWKETPTSSTSV